MAIIGRPYQGTHQRGNWESDNAYDLSAPLGTPILAAFGGTVGASFGYDITGGNRLHIAGAAGEAYYAHMQSFAIGVYPFAQVRAGQIIGYVGATGNARGTTPHLHFSTKPPLDPGQFLGVVIGAISGMSPNPAQSGYTPGAGTTASAHRILTPEQIAAVAYFAGFRGTRLANAVAIAMAESGSDQFAVGDGGSSRGLWQIYRPAHPGVTDQCAFTPSCAARQAFTISGGGLNFRPWSVYKNGAYKRHYPRALAAADAIENSALMREDAARNADIAGTGFADAFGVGGVVNAVVSVPEFLGKLSDINTWKRIGQVVAGIVLIVVSLRVLTGGNFVPKIPGPV